MMRKAMSVAGHTQLCSGFTHLALALGMLEFKTWSAVCKASTQPSLYHSRPLGNISTKIDIGSQPENPKYSLKEREKTTGRQRSL